MECRYVFGSIQGAVEKEGRGIPRIGPYKRKQLEIAN